MKYLFEHREIKTCYGCPCGSVYTADEHKKLFADYDVYCGLLKGEANTEYCPLVEVQDED